MLNETALALGSHRSCIRELYEYGLRRAAQVGPDRVYDYSLGNPSIPTPPQVRQALLDILAQEDPVSIHGYTPAAGDFAARQAIAADLNLRFGADVQPQELFLGCGAAAELVAVLRALSVPEGEVVAIAPFFPEYEPFTREAGLRLRVAAPDIPDFQIRPEAVDAVLTKNTVAVIVNSPNNPSGAVYRADSLRALAALLRQRSAQYGHPIYLIADEPYRELVYDDIQVPFIPMLYDDTIVCYSYSKSLSLPGERIGYVYVPRRAADGAALLTAISGAARAVGHVCAPSLFQKVIARCAGVRPDLSAYARNRHTLYEALVEAGYTVARPDGAFYLFVQAPGGDAVAFSARARQQDLLLVPGDDFGCPGWLRICYCVRYETITNSLPIFRNLLRD